jgi:hypothetical protein
MICGKLASTVENAAIGPACRLNVLLVTVCVYNTRNKCSSQGEGENFLPGGLSPGLSERTLLLLALLGGSPAAWVARHYFHHKTSKRSFVIRFRLIVLIQAVCMLAYLATHFHPLFP